MTVRFVDDRDVVFRALAIAALVAAVVYVALRIADLSLAYELMLGRRYHVTLEEPVQAAIVLTLRGAPLCLFAVDVFYLAEQALAVAAYRERRGAHVDGAIVDERAAPIVSVLVPVLDEPVAVVAHTITACAAIDWPRDRFEALVLDDRGRDDLAGVVDAAKKTGLAVTLRSRVTEGARREGYKAGNLNYGVSCARADAALFALLDADQAPRPELLRALAPYAALERFGFVQAPQTYRGARVDVWDRPCREFHEVAQAYRAHLDGTMLTGTSALVSRAALAGVGGFDERTVTEDLWTGAAIQAAGFASAYHPLPVADGLVPASKYDLLRQRLRWAQGTFQFLLRFPLVKLGARRALAYVAGAAHYVEPFARFTLALVPPVVMLAGVDAGLYYSPSTLMALSTFAVLRHLSRERWCKKDVVERAGGAFVPLALAPIYAWALATSIVRRRLVFHATPKGGPEDVRPRDLALLAPAVVVAFVNGAGLVSYVDGIVVGEVPALTAFLEYGGIIALAAWFLVTAACVVLVPAAIANRS